MHKYGQNRKKRTKLHRAETLISVIIIVQAKIYDFIRPRRDLKLENKQITHFSLKAIVLTWVRVLTEFHPPLAG